METETQGLKDAAEQALVSLIQSVADAASFLKGEIPIAVRELLTYYTALYVLYVVCAVVLATGIGLAIRKISRLEDWDTDLCLRDHLHCPGHRCRVAVVSCDRPAEDHPRPANLADRVRGKLGEVT
jgi:hypothetical protein